MAGRKNTGAELAAPVQMEQEEVVQTEETETAQVEETAQTEKEAVKQFVVHAPEEKFTGVIGGVRFIAGEAGLQSDDSRMLSWFRENGYLITVRMNL